MKYYQDTKTGQIYAFEDDFDPFKSNNKNIPKTLSEKVIEKPISDIPSYNPAWINFSSS